MEWLEADLQLLYLIVALGGLPFAAGVLLLRFGGKLLGTQLHWSQAAILSGVMVQGLLIPFFAGIIGAVFLAALLVHGLGMKFLRGALPLTIAVWIVDTALFLTGRFLFFHHF